MPAVIDSPNFLKDETKKPLYTYFDKLDFVKTPYGFVIVFNSYASKGNEYRHDGSIVPGFYESYHKKIINGRYTLVDVRHVPGDKQADISKILKDKGYDNIYFWPDWPVWLRNDF